MVREEIQNNIYVDDEYLFAFSSDEYWHDQAYVDFPIVFPLVRVQLESSSGLDALADKLRKDDGLLPLFDDSGEYNSFLWYNFYIELNGYNDHHVDTCIYVETCDGEWSSDIYLSDEEQEYIYQQINKRLDCERALQDCVEFFKEDNLTILERRAS